MGEFEACGQMQLPNGETWVWQLTDTNVLGVTLPLKLDAPAVKLVGPDGQIVELLWGVQGRVTSTAWLDALAWCLGRLTDKTLVRFEALILDADDVARGVVRYGVRWGRRSDFTLRTFKGRELWQHYATLAVNDTGTGRCVAKTWAEWDSEHYTRNRERLPALAAECAPVARVVWAWPSGAARCEPVAERGAELTVT